MDRPIRPVGFSVFACSVERIDDPNAVVMEPLRIVCGLLGKDCVERIRFGQDRYQQIMRPLVAKLSKIAPTQSSRGRSGSKGQQLPACSLGRRGGYGDVVTVCNARLRPAG